MCKCSSDFLQPKFKMEKYQELIKAIILMVASLTIAIFIYRKGYFKSHPEADFAVKVSDKKCLYFF